MTASPLSVESTQPGPGLERVRALQELHRLNDGLAHLGGDPLVTSTAATALLPDNLRSTVRATADHLALLAKLTSEL